MGEFQHFLKEASDLAACNTPAISRPLSPGERQLALDRARAIAAYDLSLARNVSEWRDLLNLLQGDVEPICGKRVDYDDGIMCTYGPCLRRPGHTGNCRAE